MAFEADKQPGYAIGLSAVNHAVLEGAGDSLWSGNSTVTAVIAAVRAYALGAGYSADDIERVARGLRIGQLSGALSETHGLTTTAGARSAFTALDPTLASTFTGYAYS
jgi:hypothetical protein